MKAKYFGGFWNGLGQALVVVLGWLSFGWLWLLVAQRPWEVRGLMWLIGGSLVVLPLVTLCWVWHNRSIYRRKGPRRAPTVASEHYPRDWNGLEVHADWPALRRARIVTVHVGDGGKRYQLYAVPGPEPREQALT